jgi:hypothetical protein
MKLMKQKFLVLILISVAQYITAQDSTSEWLESNFNLVDPNIKETVLVINDAQVLIAYESIQEASSEEYLGIFYRAVLFTELPSNQLVLFFNGPVVMSPDGSRIFDFSQQRYRYINFYGWEIIPSNNDRGMGIHVSVVTDEGDGRPDSISISYFDEYNQFGTMRTPFKYGYHFNFDDPLLIGMARSGMPSENTDAYDFYTRNIRDMNDEEIRLLRNAVFALNGYLFNSLELREYFYQFNWYIPYTNDSDSVNVSPNQQRLIDYLLTNY